MRIIKVIKNFLTSMSTCSCCGGSGVYDEGYGPEECSACGGTGFEV